MVALVSASGGRAQQPSESPTRLPPTIQQVAFEPRPVVEEVALAATADSLPAPELSLADLEQMALSNNPTLTSAQARVAAARGRQVQAGLYPNPVVGYAGREIGNNDTAGAQGGFIGQQFITGGKLRLDRAVAGQNVQESRAQFAAQELRVLNDVRLRFYDTLVAQRKLELTARLARISQKFVDISQQLVDARQLSENDLLQAEIETHQTQIDEDNARNERREAWRRLAAVVGATMLAPQPLAGELTGSIPELEWEDMLTTVLGQSPELAAAEARIRRARLTIERARRENIPNIDMRIALMHMNVTGDDVAGVQAGMPVPILNRNQGNIMAAQAELVSAENERQRIELDLQDRLAVAFRRYGNARQQADRYEHEILPKAQRSLDLVTRGYEAGQIDYLTLLTSQRTYIRTNLAYVDALGELRRAIALIEGQLLLDSLGREPSGR